MFDEWQELLKPFTRAATPAMMSGVTSFYEKMGEWQSDMPAAAFTADTFKFIQEIGRRRKA